MADLTWEQVFDTTEKRDFVGYCGNTPSRDTCWPNGARIALQFVINYEEGGENCILNGDKGSEHLLSEIVGVSSYIGERHVNMETLYEYGSRAGFWRILRLFKSKGLTATVYAVGMALEKNPEAGKAMIEAGFEVASHGYRWIDYQNVNVDEEREHIKKAIEANINVTGTRPLGLYQGKPNEKTRSLAVEEGGFLYDSDSYNDDLPYWTYWQNKHTGEYKSHLVIPYTLDCNDMRFSQGLECDRFFNYLKDAFDVLYEEGKEFPKMMTVGLHCRVIGRPARIKALSRFMDYVKEKEDVWICQRVEIAKHWHNNHPAKSL